jgi:uncharacterized membrane protein
MKTVNAVVSIDAPAQRVFQILCDIERWPEWTSSMQSVQRLDSGPFTVASQARVVQPKLRPSVWQVSAMDEARNFTWVSRAPGVRMEAGHAVEAAGAGCRVTLSFTLSGLLSPIVGLLYGGLITEYVNTEAQGLKKHSEKLTKPP